MLTVYFYHAHYLIEEIYYSLLKTGITIQYTGDILQHFTPETYICLLTNVTQYQLKSEKKMPVSLMDF